MLMSDAIILGSTLRPQCHRVLFDGLGSCANGAALEAIGVTPDDAMTWKVNWFDILGIRDEYTGVRNTERAAIVQDIGHRNDRGQTRESIAQWLRESGRDFEIPAVRSALSVEDEGGSSLICQIPENAPVCEERVHAGGKTL